MILDVYCDWEDEFRSYSDAHERFLCGPPYPEDMPEHLLSLKAPSHPRPAEAARNVDVAEYRPDAGAAAPKPLELPAAGDAILYESRRFRSGISSRNGQKPGKGTRYRYDMGERQNYAAYHD